MHERNSATKPVLSDGPTIVCDVVVVGGGLAGKAAALQLAKGGLKVICISPREGTRAPVGESLDWSAPDLLKTLGLPMDSLVTRQMATWKRHVTLCTRDGRCEHYVPSPWLGRSPLNVDLRTLHLDRVRVDQELSKLLIDAGIELVPDKVVDVERSSPGISSVRTANGKQYSAAWFIDASGLATSLFAREFKLPTIEYGPAKVALWAYFPVSNPVDGTTLYMDPSPSQYLDWVWEIPVNPQNVSVGVVTTGALMKRKRDQGLAVTEIYRQELAKYSRFDSLLGAGSIDGINVTSFKCRVYKKVAGPNWLICGEAASMVDPITANGVTAALRHAADASALILKYSPHSKLPLRARVCYSSRILQMATFFNNGIEEIVYEPTVRNQIGLHRAGTVYTTPAWSMNVVYAKLRPRGIISTLFLSSLLAIFRLSASMFYHVCLLTGRNKEVW